MRYRVVSIMLGLVLVAAGTLKAREFRFVDSWTLWALSDDAFSVLAFSVLLGTAEILFGWWMVVGLWPRLSWWLAVGCFTAFLAASVDRGLAGAASCGCLGTMGLSVPPWHMAAFDALALFMLWTSNPQPLQRSVTKLRLAVYGMVVIVSAGALVLLGQRPWELEVADALPDDASTVTLHPQTWVGQQLPLLRHVDVGTRLERGEWMVMLYHHTCPRCQAVLPQFLGLAHQLAGQYDRPQAALIEAPPFPDENVRRSQSTVWLHGRLDAGRRWVGGSPYFMRLKDGRVEIATDSFDTLTKNVLSQQQASGSSDGYLFPEYRRIRRETFLREIACGPLALIAVLTDLGIPLSPDQIEGLLAEAGSKGIDMLRLKELAEAHGVHGLGVMVSPAELRRINQPAIVHLAGRGFAAETGFVSGGVRLVYPLQPPGIVPDDSFAASFGENGYALLLSRSPLNAVNLGLNPPDVRPPSGPHLLLSRRVLPVGRVHRKDWGGSITLTNDGSETLRIEKVEALCNCMSARVDKAELKPGEGTELRVKGSDILPGPFTFFVELHTNEKGRQTLKVPIHGYAEQPVGFERAAAVYENVLPGQQLKVEIALDVPPTIQPKNLTVRVSDERPWIRIAQNAPVAAKIERRRSNEHVLALRWQGEKEPGWYRYRVDVCDGGPEIGLAAPFHLAVQVVPPVEFLPHGIAVAENEWKSGWSRRIQCKFNHAFQGSWSVELPDTELSKRISATLKPTSGGMEFFLSAESGTQAPVSGVKTANLIAPDGSVHPLELIFGNGVRSTVPKRSPKK